MHSWQGCRVLILELTGQCNFACRYCYAAEKKPLSMPLAVAMQAVASVAASQESQEPFLVQFTGGEPLLAINAASPTDGWCQATTGSLSCPRCGYVGGQRRVTYNCGCEAADDIANA